MRKHRHVHVLSGVVTLVAIAYVGGCGSDASAPVQIAGVGGAGGLGAGAAPAAGGNKSCGSPEFPCAAGGAVAKGGAPAMSSGGTPTSGGGNGAGGDVVGDVPPLCEPGVCTTTACPDATDVPTDGFAPCTLVGCKMAHCVPEGSIPPNEPLDQLKECDTPRTRCVPDDYTHSFGRFQAKTCKSLLGAEGRCISTCALQVNGLMDALPKDVCGDNERCAPCINPNDGTKTDACVQGCDPGPSAETVAHPALFDKCQNGEGVCTPKSIIPAVLLPFLQQYTCKSADYVCAPIKKAQNLKYNFPKCEPGNPFVGVLAQPGPNGQRGGCVPAWLADSNPFEGIFLVQDTCKTGEKCAPCHDPLRPDPSDPTGQASTGACPVPLPSDPSGGLPPEGSTPAAGGSGAGGGAGSGGKGGSGGL